MDIFESAVHLLVRALFLEIREMSTSALALGVGLLVALARIRDTYGAGGWLAVKKELTTDAWKGARVTLIIWAGLFCFFLGGAIFQDHKGLKSLLGINTRALRQAKASLIKGDIGCHTDLDATKQAVAVQSGINQTLQKQNRDEQVLIAGCQQQALRLLQPPEPKMSQLVVDNEKLTGDRHRTRWLLLTNTLVPSINLRLACTRGVARLESAEIRPLGGGGGILIGNSNGRLSDTAWQLNQTGTWSQASPLLVTMEYTGEDVAVCSFSTR